MNDKKPKYAVLIARASSKKQVIEGDTLESQVKEAQYFADKNEYVIKKVFKFVESATIEERAFFKEVIEYCVDPLNEISIFLVKDISRFTRGGADVYLELKKNLQRFTIRIIDFSTGIIQDSKNTLESRGFEYKWSIYSPSEASEIAEAERAKSEVRQSLTRMIGQEIDYTASGFWMRNAPLGLMLEKTETPYGRRGILKPHPVESKWIIKIAEMRSSGSYTNDEIVEAVNALGFQTRKLAVRDKVNKQVIGYRGGSSLNRKLLERIVSKPIYSGVMYEKWTGGNCVESWGFNGLYNISIFNRINNGKILIKETSNGYKITRNSKRTVRQKDNPLYPYKRVILCPLCKKPLLASASRGKLGKKHPAYHCSRNHIRFSVSKKDLESTVELFTKRLKFKQDFIGLFQKSFLYVWDANKRDSLTESMSVDSQIQILKDKQSSLLRALAEIDNLLVKEAMTQEVENIVIELKNLTKERNSLESDFFNIHEALKYATNLMEHPYEILEDTENSMEKAIIFRSFFKETPSYEELANGTPVLSHIFGLTDRQDMSEEQLVTPRGIEPRLPG